MNLSAASGEGRCRGCGGPAARMIGACGACLRDGRVDPLAVAAEAREKHRRVLGLPSRPPEGSGPACRLCANLCRPAVGAPGYCGARRGGPRGPLGGISTAAVHWYFDPLPTNCVADWVCAGTRQTGRLNLAVFYYGCTFDCLFCQNWQHRLLDQAPLRRPGELAAAVDERTECICHFGGDPGPHVPYSLRASRLARQRRPVRICWETNGRMSRACLRAMMDLSLESGGCIKFDLKCWDAGLHRVLCGVDPEPTRENFAWAAGRIRERPDPPPLVASTLLVPGYVDSAEIAALGRFIASLDPEIPWALLAFHPDDRMRDLPCTSFRQAEECLRAARKAGVLNVRVGNLHLLP